MSKLAIIKNWIVHSFEECAPEVTISLLELNLFEVAHLMTWANERGDSVENDSISFKMVIKNHKHPNNVKS